MSPQIPEPVGSGEYGDTERERDGEREKEEGRARGKEKREKGSDRAFMGIQDVI